jgi:ElaB/YqjD/DUF883 family membrane-anchored ribosome-binding protein
MRAQMDDTRAALSEKLEMLEQRIVDTVHGAADAVTDTVDNVKDAVHETVENVKETFDVRLQVDRHPWAMVGGSVALGFLGGCLLIRHGAAEPSAIRYSPSTPADRPPITAQRNGDVNVAPPLNGASANQDRDSAHAASGPAGPAGVNNPFGTEFAKLKKMAIGAVLGLVRDMITQSAPEQMKIGLTEAIDGLTVQLGGEPIRGPILKTAEPAT